MKEAYTIANTATDFTTVHTLVSWGILGIFTLLSVGLFVIGASLVLLELHKWITGKDFFNSKYH